MILRNPSAWRDSMFMICSLFLFCISNSLSSQGVIGIIKENLSKQPVAGAIVSVMKGDSVVTSFSTDSLGRYAYMSAEALRIHLTIKALGFRTYVSEDIVLDGYSTYRLENVLERTSYELGGVTVISSSRQSQPYVQHITKDDLLTVAGNFDDPVRIAHSQPGIVLINDQANHLSARGQLPALNSWYLESLEIVNPNHTNNAGTISDLPAQSGGGVNMFSAQSLGSTDVYTGLNPLSIGRSAGAVIDMHLHESAKPEFRAKAGFLGFEFGGGTGIGANGILDLNLRYSFTGLLANLGVDFGGEKIGFYDAVVSYHQQGLKHKLKLFGWAGRSENEFDKVESQQEIKRYKDFFDIDYENDILGLGIRYESVLSRKATLSTGAAYSILQTKYGRQGQFGPAPVAFNVNGETRLLSSNAEISFQHSSRLNTSAGIDYTNKTFTYSTFAFSPFRDESFLRPYISAEIELSPVFTIALGGEVNYAFSMHLSTSTPGYRALLQWNTTDNSILYMGLRHAAGQRVLVSSIFESYSVPLVIDKYELGWNLSGAKNSVEIKSYFQEINYLTILNQMNGFVHLADFSEPIAGKRISDTGRTGRAQYYGLEGQWEYFNGEGFKLTINQSIFKSLREISNEGLKPGRFDNQFASHLSISKEIIKTKKGKNRIWNFSLRGLFQGGLWEPAIDVEESKILETTVYEDPYEFGIRLPHYKRVDAGIYRTIANPKIRWRWSLDIQNLLGLSNVGYHYYDPFLQRIELQEQLGIIPVFSVQASW